MAQFTSKGGRAAQRDAECGSWPDAEFLKNYPALSEYMALSKWEDGTERETATLLLFLERGRLTACVTDRDANRVAFVSSGSLESLLECLETGLQDSSLDWRERKGGGRRK
jgi:hypothetical protein